jgi:hypothetical protein
VAEDNELQHQAEEEMKEGIFQNGRTAKDAAMIDRGEGKCTRALHSKKNFQYRVSSQSALAPCSSFSNEGCLAPDVPEDV